VSDNNNDIAELSVSLELNSLQYKAKDRQNLKFTLTNGSNERVNVLKWHTPLEGIKDDIFGVKKQEESALYLGKIVKRGLPKPQDYVTLDPKGSISTNFDLDDVYDISQAGNYSVEFVSPLLDVGKEEPTALAAKLSETRDFTPKRIRSNVVEFELIEDRNPRLSKGVELEFSERLAAVEVPAFNNCSTNQQDLLEDSLSEAEQYAIESDRSLSSTSPSNRAGSARYKEWFGIYLEQRYNTITSNFDKILDVLTNKRITFNCTCEVDDPDNTFAYVFPARPYEIFLCSLFWNGPLTGTDSKAGTIIHELSHFYVVAGTTDRGGLYGQESSRRLARNNPEKAITHADCHEYFAENTPPLRM
jgi:peptidyl-Lys metalloendopeptidase